jgi:hypothetical protein
MQLSPSLSIHLSQSIWPRSDKWISQPSSNNSHSMCREWVRIHMDHAKVTSFV